MKKSLMKMGIILLASSLFFGCCPKQPPKLVPVYTKMPILQTWEVDGLENIHYQIYTEDPKDVNSIKGRRN